MSLSVTTQPLLLAAPPPRAPYTHCHLGEERLPPELTSSGCIDGSSRNSRSAKAFPAAPWNRLDSAMPLPHCSGSPLGEGARHRPRAPAPPLRRCHLSPAWGQGHRPRLQAHSHARPSGKGQQRGVAVHTSSPIMKHQPQHRATCPRACPGKQTPFQWLTSVNPV